MKKLISTGLVGMSLMAGAANAATVSSQIFSGFQQWSDNSAEILVNKAGSTVGDTSLDIGDNLFGIFNIQSFEQFGSPTRVIGANGVNEMTGVFDIQVTGKSCLGSVCSFEFAAGSTFSSFGANTAVLIFDGGSVVDYSRLGTDLHADFLSAGWDTLTNAIAPGNSLLLALGFGDISNFWNATSLAGDQPTVIGGLPSPGNGGVYNLGLDILINNTGRQFNDVSCFNPDPLVPGGAAVVSADICGSGSLLAKGGVTSPFDNFDNVDFTVNVVPEPGTLALLGLGFLGFARRRVF